MVRHEKSIPMMRSCQRIFAFLKETVMEENIWSGLYCGGAVRIPAEWAVRSLGGRSGTTAWGKASGLRDAG